MGTQFRIKSVEYVCRLASSNGYWPAGTTEFLIKPVTPTRLYNRIAAVIEDNRCYVRSEGFFGPDRRRADRPFTGPERRDAGSVVMIDL